MLAVLAIAAVCLAPPVDGPIIAGYEPAGQYAGHWGVDYEAGYLALVFAPTSGRVTFAGSVAGMNSVTIQPVTGFKVSVSFLSAIFVRSGSWVSHGDVIGMAGAPHDVAGVHMSTRIDGRYVDPENQMGCKRTDITRALRLVTSPQPYPRTRANRNPRRHIRPHPYRPPSRWGDRPPSGSARRNAVHAGRRSVAESRSFSDTRATPSGDGPVGDEGH